MITLKGKRNSAMIFADKIDKQTKTQIASLLREEAYADSRIRIMPDTHSGKNVAVGTTMTLSGRVAPSLVGVDIGCGMEVVWIEESEADLEKLDRTVRRYIPSGSKIHECRVKDFAFGELLCMEAVDTQRAARSIGTLGSGNHFIELDRSECGELLLVIHSGSRQLGSDVAAYYTEAAYRYQCKKLRKRVKQAYYEGRREDGFERGPKRAFAGSVSVRREDAVLEGALFEDYLHDMRIVTDFADLNRRTMAEIICREMGFTVKDRFSCVHNYIDTEHMILRKGAISARQGERVIIPLNMRDGAVLGTGLGSSEWNFSAPHGAGRAYSRTEARFAFTEEDFQKEMEGVYTTTACLGTIDECPMAYKSPERILGMIGDTVSIEQIVRPIYNYKAC